MQKLVLLGIGGNASDIFDAVVEINRVKPTYEVLGYVTADGKPREKGGLTFLGGLKDVRSLPEDVQIAGFIFSPGVLSHLAGYGGGTGPAAGTLCHNCPSPGVCLRAEQGGPGIGDLSGNYGGGVCDHWRPRDNPAERGPLPR